VWLQQIPATPFFAASTIVSFGDSSLTHFTRCLAALFWGEASHRRASHPIPALRDGVVLSRLRAKIEIEMQEWKIEKPKGRWFNIYLGIAKEVIT
jgi:hypothetical protein